VPTRGSREFMASVRSSGQCRVVQRRIGVVVHGGSMMASMAVQWWSRGEGGKRVAPRGGGGCSFSSSQRWLAMVVRVAAGAGAALKLWGW
jgi:hypothetical protein